MSLMIPIGIRIVMNTRSTPLKILKRMEVNPTLSKHPVKVPNKVRTTTILPTKPVAVFLTLFCVSKDTLLDEFTLNSLANRSSLQSNIELNPSNFKSPLHRI